MSKILILNLLKKIHIEYFLKGHLIILNLSKKKIIARYFNVLFKVPGHCCPLIMVGMGTLEKLNFLRVDLFSLEVTYPPIRTQPIILQI